MTDLNPYRAYTEDAVLNSQPLGLVIALYEGAVEAVRQAKHCLDIGDIAGRSRPINKASNILVELMKSLDHKKGGDISRNLSGLYNYMQRRVLEAHLRQNRQALEEVEGLLSQMLEGWKHANGALTTSLPLTAATREEENGDESDDSDYGYGHSSYAFYHGDYGDLNARPAYSF